MLISSNRHFLEMTTEQCQIFVFQEGKVRKRMVVSGLIDSDYVEILSGLTARDRVIIQGPEELQDGQRVTLGSN